MRSTEATLYLLPSASLRKEAELNADVSRSKVDYWTHSYERAAQIVPLHPDEVSESIQLRIEQGQMTVPEAAQVSQNLGLEI